MYGPQVLSDGQKRANYDAYGHAAAAGSHGGGSAAGGSDFTANQAEEIFRQFFGGFSGGFDFDGFQQSSDGENTIRQVSELCDRTI